MTMTDIENGWYFWNHCFLGRTSLYQSRRIKQSIKMRLWRCSICEIEINSYVLHEDAIVCHKCKASITNKHLSEQRKEVIKKAQELSDSFSDLLAECTKKGTCDILAAHHELLINDNDRLKTDFMLELVCKNNNYTDKWDELKNNAINKLKKEQLKLPMCAREKNLIYPLQ